MLHNRRKLKHSSRHRIQGTAHQQCNATLIGLPTVNTYSTDRIVKQTTSTGETWKMAYKRSGACVAKVLPAPVINGGATQTWEYTCRAGQPLSSRICAGGTCTQSGTESLAGTCPEVDSDDSRLAGWRFYGGTNIETTVTKPENNWGQTPVNFSRYQYRICLRLYLLGLWAF